MKRIIVSLVALVFCLSLSISRAAEPLRIFLRGGPKTHGPAGNGLHDHERWVKDWTQLLTERGAKVAGGLKFPTESELAQTDVLVMFAADAGNIQGEQRAYFEKFLQRGGGIVCFHDAVCGNDPQWFKTVIGGAWEHGHSKWLESEISFYYVNNTHPITESASNFDIDDEIYWDLHMMPEAKILAASWQPDKRNTRNGRLFPHIYDVVPQMWVYEKDNYRSFVSILGHKYGTFQQPHVQAVLLRGIAWAGKRDVNELCTKEELASLRYPKGGPTAPEKSAALLELHPDFHQNLVAAEPLISKAMNIDWDPAGRLWVAESPEYPNGRSGMRTDMAGEEWKDHGGIFNDIDQQNRRAQDRISILSDSDGDGRMDKKEIFFDDLELITSTVFHRDGVIAAVAPDIFWIRDTNGDGRGDKVETLYTGLGIGDRHAVINNLRWGFDGWIYATHGYSAGTVTSGDGKQSFGRISSGVVRFKPDGSAFEQYSSKGGNTWGLDVAWDNEVFYTQPTSGDLLNHVVLPESYLARGKVGNTPSFKSIIVRRKVYPLIEYDNLAYVQIDQVGYFTAAAGCAIYDGGTWPKEWNYHYFTTEPTVNLVHEEEVTPDGVSYAARKIRQEEFIGGRDAWYRPIETRVGPDGALYVIDFYNQAVIHNDTRGPRHNRVNAAVRPDRDHYFGRIWKVDHKQAKTLPIPDLTKAGTADLLKALQHPNQHIRMNALRLLVEHHDRDAVPGLVRLTAQMENPAASVAALWALHRMGAMEAPVLTTALNSPVVAIRKNGLEIAQETRALLPVETAQAKQAILKALRDADPRVRLEAILALGQAGLDEAAAAQLVLLYPSLNDRWMESAVVGLMAEAPLTFLNAALASANPAEMTELIGQLTGQIAAKQDAALAAQLVTSTAAKPAALDALKIAVLEGLAKGLKPEVAPTWNADLQKAFQSLLKSPNPALAATALPLIGRWDKERTLSGELNALVQSQLGRLREAGLSDDTRAQLAVSLLGVRQLDERILAAVGGLLAADYSAELKKPVLEALGATGDPKAGVILARAYSGLTPALQESSLGQMLKRTDWSRDFLQAIRSGDVSHSALSPSAVHRLRYHSDKEVAAAANQLFDELRGPELKEKNALIARLTPAVQRPGNATKGKELFEQNCGTCHIFGEAGRQVGPSLNGMGAHGAAELLIHVLDPNRALEDTYIATSIETKDEEIYDGIVAQENRRNVVLRNASGEIEIAKENIQSRRSTGKSLMPEGFEALGEEGLRDLLAYITAADARYRFLDLTDAYTTDSRKGLYITPDNVNDTFRFRKYGPVSVDGIPFNILDPVRSPGGRNVVVLKGGGYAGAYSKTMPQKVEVKVGFPVARLHFLGGVAGWGWPYGGEGTKDMPVMQVTAVYEDGGKTEMIFKNGVEFADWIAVNDVPGSKLAGGVVAGNQIRYFSKPLTRVGVLEKLILESFNNSVAPTTVAITAELGQPDATPPTATSTASAAAKAAAPSESAFAKAAPGAIKVFMMGGGSAHDFERFFHQADKAILQEGGLAAAVYSGKADETSALIKDADVLYQSANHELPPSARQAILDHVAAGKGVVLVHAGIWYNWRDWPEYNRELCGGGSRGHDRLGPFTVNVTDGSHPVMKGVPTSFEIIDEHYWFEPDPQGTPIKPLAIAHSKQKDKDYPMVFIVQHPKARIVAIALGHDDKAHGLEAYQTLLRNAVTWAAGK